MGAYQTIQVQIQAQRYGTEEGGEWYSGAVADVAAFLLQVPVDRMQDSMLLMTAVRPAGCWDPPSEAVIEWLDKQPSYTRWAPLRLGDWMIRFPETGFVTQMRHEDFVENYEKRPVE